MITLGGAHPSQVLHQGLCVCAASFEEWGGDLFAIGDGQRFDRDAHAEHGSYLGQGAQCWIDLTGRKESPHGGRLGADRASKGRLR